MIIKHFLPLNIVDNNIILLHKYEYANIKMAALSHFQIEIKVIEVLAINHTNFICCHLLDPRETISVP